MQINVDDQARAVLRAIPAVTQILKNEDIVALENEFGHQVVTDWIRGEVDALRATITSGSEVEISAEDTVDFLVAAVKRRAVEFDHVYPRRVINGTGVILHTGLGRAPISNAAVDAIRELSGAGNVEVDLADGARRYRGHQLQPLWHALTGCEDSLVVNNNAAATLLTLAALCNGREVIISRGQLIEIGGSFRLPEIFELGGVRLREVGTTNRTRLSDYEKAINSETAAIMRVHPSNYRIVGFTDEPPLADMCALARQHDVLMIDDIGSGSLVDVTKYGLPEEPSFPDSMHHGADLILGSGDKLLGGPQAGIILGASKLVEPIRKHPLARTVRVDKLALAGLAATLKLYLRGTHERDIPALAMMSASIEDLETRGRGICEALKRASIQACVVEGEVTVGGGSVPASKLAGRAVRLTVDKMSSDELSRRLRLGKPALMSRLREDHVEIELRGIPDWQDADIVSAVVSSVRGN